VAQWDCDTAPTKFAKVNVPLGTILWNFYDCKMFYSKMKFVMLVASQQHVSQIQKDVLINKEEKKIICSNCQSFWSLDVYR
jgi:hypothetical protein